MKPYPVPLRTRGFTLPDDLYRRANIAAASLGGMSTSEYVRRALVCVLAADAASNPLLAAHFAQMAKQGETDPTPVAHELVPA